MKSILLQKQRLKTYNLLIDGRNFYDQPINDLTKQYDKVRKVSIGEGSNYTKECLLDYEYSYKNYKLTVVDLSKQKALDADSRANQQIVFQGIAGQKLRLYTILEKSVLTVLGTNSIRILQRNSKSFVRI